MHERAGGCAQGISNEGNFIGTFFLGKHQMLVLGPKPFHVRKSLSVWHQMYRQRGRRSGDKNRALERSYHISIRQNGPVT